MRYKILIASLLVWFSMMAFAHSERLITFGKHLYDETSRGIAALEQKHTGG